MRLLLTRLYRQSVMGGQEIYQSSLARYWLIEKRQKHKQRGGYIKPNIINHSLGGERQYDCYHKTLAFDNSLLSFSLGIGATNVVKTYSLKRIFLLHMCFNQAERGGVSDETLFPNKNRYTGYFYPKEFFQSSVYIYI